MFLPFSLSHRFSLNLLIRVFQMVSSPLLEVALWSRLGTRILGNIARTQLQSWNRKSWRHHTAQCLPASMAGPSYRSGWARSLGLEDLFRPCSPGKYSALITQVSSSLHASAAPLCTVFAHTASVTATSGARLCPGAREKSSTYTILEPHRGAGRSSGRASTSHFLTLHSWKSELADTITFRIYTLPSAKGFEITDLLSSVGDT